MTTQSAIDLLEPATAFRLAGKYARQAQQYLTHGDLQQAYIACLDGHFVAGHDGDDSLGSESRPDLAQEAKECQLELVPVETKFAVTPGDL